MTSEAGSLSTLDMALKELGMLSSADGHKDYLREKLRHQHQHQLAGRTRNQSSAGESSRCCSVLQMNTDYVTGVVLGGTGASEELCSLRWAKWPGEGRPRPHHHLRPYYVPWRREERTRTRSENCDDEGSPDNSQEGGAAQEVVPPSSSGGGGLFRSRSLEDLRVGVESVASQGHEVETVSQKIQQLHVH